MSTFPTHAGGTYSARKYNRYRKYPHELDDKKMTLRQEGILTIMTAFAFYFPSERQVSLLHVCTWLKIASVSTIIDTIIDAAARRPRLRSPSRYIWETIRPDCTQVVRF